MRRKIGARYAVLVAKHGTGFCLWPSKAQGYYNKVVIQQLTELWTQYGKLFEIWFDGGVMTDDKSGIASAVTTLIKVHQPQAILFQGPSYAG